MKIDLCEVMVDPIPLKGWGLGTPVAGSSYKKQ